jgi:hypothetical protein
MKLKTLVASVAVSGAVLAGAPVASAGNHGGGNAVEQAGLVNVAITDTNLNVTVPINAAVGIAANVCNIAVNAAVLGAALQEGPFTGECDAQSDAFAGQELRITQIT